MDKYEKTLCGIGYFGEGKHKARVNHKVTKKYNSWSNMINRCYNPYVLNKRPTYIDCYVESDLHCFQNFGDWFDENYYEVPNEKMHLDKDILCKGNKIYSKDTMIFVPEKINSLFTKDNKTRGEYPIGVTYHKKNNNLRVICSITNENGETELKHLGCFPLNRPFQAFTCYKNFKENYIKQVADKYYSKGLIPKKLYDAMYKYEVEIND